MLINGHPMEKRDLRQRFMQQKPKPAQKQSASPAPPSPAKNSSVPQKSNFPELKNRIIMYIRQNGPVIPIQVSKAFGGDTMFAGAVLSELIANRVLNITNAKIGGSPVYYMPGQEEKLQILRDHLGQKPKQAYDLLKERFIMRDSECEPWQRIALREIKDFAMPIPVRHDDGSEEVFWRWHLLSEEEARDRIKAIVEGKSYRKMDEITPHPEPIKPAPEPIKPQPIEPVPPKKHEIEKPREEQRTLDIKEEKKKIEKPKKPKKEKIDDYKNELLSFLQQKGLEVQEEVEMKKNEYAFVVKVDSNLGKLSYIAIAKKKKKLSDDDITLAYSVGVQHKLPVIIVGKELSSKAEKLLSTGMKGVAFIKL